MSAFVRTLSALRGNPYVVSFTTAFLIVAAGALLFSAMTRSADTVVIEVVPLPDPTSLRVQVAGAVGKPGVYIMPVGSTVGDAVASAGGFAGDAGLPDATMAALLADGDVIDVPAGDAPVASADGPLDVNTASAEDLERLPGIGPVLAGRIVSYRSEHGPFQSVDDLAGVSGISERMVNEMRHLITVES